MKIKDIFNIARVECNAEAHDIKDETLLTILNENVREFISVMQTKKYEEYFAVRITHDLIENQFRYGKLEYKDEENRDIRINKILKVFVKGKEVKRVDVLEEEMKDTYLNYSYGISGGELYVFHNDKGITIDAITLVGLREIPFITDIEIDIDSIFLGKFYTDSKILKLGLKAFIYERQGDINASINTMQIYKSELRKYINRLGKIKEPIEREIIDLSIYE